MNNLEKLIKDKVRAMEHFEAQDEVLQQINARIDADKNFMLIKLAERFGQSRSSLAADLLETAIWDAWFHAEMPMTDVPEEGDREAFRLPGYYGNGELHEEYKEYMKKLGVTVHF